LPGKVFCNAVIARSAATCKIALNESLFFSLDHAREKLAARAADYNIHRPYSSISYQTRRPMPLTRPQQADPLRHMEAPRAGLLLLPRRTA
jgi:hypothetical protein